MESQIGQFTGLITTAISDAESRDALARLADEQAALRRVATLVAQDPPSHDVFTAVTEELGHLVPTQQTAMSRYDSDNMFTTVAVWSPDTPAFPVGLREPPGGNNVMTIVLETGRPARINDYSASASGPIGDGARRAGVRSSVGIPIIVAGRLWGVMSAGSTHPEPLPADTEARLASFTELVATAIASAESRDALARLADEQAALRRVATLVAQDAPAATLFEAVVAEVGELLDANLTVLGRYDGDGAATAVGSWSFHTGGDSGWNAILDRWPQRAQHCRRDGQACASRRLRRRNRRGR
jgi:GAF domain-containing protein